MTAEKGDESVFGERFRRTINQFEGQSVCLLVVLGRLVFMSYISDRGLGRNAVEINVQIGFGENCRHDLNVFFEV